MAVDARCADRCRALERSLAQCEEEHGPQRCKPEFNRWRGYCVTNSACNPAGQLADPLKAERKCEQLAKRVAICEASVDGQDKASSTRDCEHQRQRWVTLCSGVRSHEQREADPAVRTASITAAYRQAAQQAAAQPPPEPRGGPVVRWLAARLADCEPDSTTRRVADAIGHHPAIAVLAMSGASSALLLQREASKPSNASLTGAQRIQGARVYIQMAVVASTVFCVTLSEIVDASGRTT